MPTIAATLVSAAVAVTVLTSCARAAVAPSAQCSLVMRGYAQASMIDSNPFQAGLKQMKLSCVTTPASWKVPVGISKKYAQRYVEGFDGVQVVSRDDYGCQQKAETQGYSRGKRSVPTFALLYFCGDYNITLHRPHISNICQDFEASKKRYDTSVLAFGDSVQAVITEGHFVNNSAGSVVLVMDSAKVRIEGGTVISGNMGNPASGLWARKMSQVVISDSIFSNNTSTDVGGAMAAMDEALVKVTATKFANNTAAFSGGAFMSQDGAVVLFEQCNFYNNTSGDVGGAVFVLGL